MKADLSGRTPFTGGSDEDAEQVRCGGSALALPEVLRSIAVAGTTVGSQMDASRLRPDAAETGTPDSGTNKRVIRSPRQPLHEMTRPNEVQALDLIYERLYSGRPSRTIGDSRLKRRRNQAS